MSSFPERRRAARYRREADSGARAARRALDESGQAIVEFVLVLPVVALLLGVAFNGWNSMDLSVQLTSAARAGAIQAANDLGAGKTLQQATDDATTAVNSEQGQTNFYQDSNPSAGNYVSVTSEPQPVSASTGTGTGTIDMNVVKITVTTTPVALVPFVHSLTVTASATARYS